MTEQPQTPEPGMPAPAGAHSPAPGDGDSESSGAAEAAPAGATEAAPSGATEAQPTDATKPLTAVGASSPAGGSAWTAPSEPSNEWSADTSGAIPSDRPEIVVGAAFAGGFLLATLLKRLAR